MDYDALINQCKDAIELLPNGYVFLLKDLFIGTYWKNLDKGVRLELGRRFKLCVNRKEIPNTVYIGRADNNSAQYKKAPDETEYKR